MQADRDDRYARESTRGRHNTQTLVTAIAVLILAGGAYLIMPGENAPAPEPVAAPDANEPPTLTRRPPAIAPEPAIAQAPDIPELAELDAEAPEPQASQSAEDAPPLPPTPEEIDQTLRNAIRDAGLTPDPALASAYSAPYLIDRGVSSIDQLARGLVPTRTLNLAKPKGSFAVRQSGLDYSLDTQGYRRYDAAIKAITSLPPGTIANLFHELRPQLSEAYAQLGYPPDAMDNTLIAALDAIIAAPLVEGEPALVSKGAMWAYADPALESASDLHKQLIRTGPDNTRALQSWARSLRAALLGN